MSIFESLRRLGYSASNEISEREIEAYMRKHPDLMESWIRYSEDQRSSTGWWITEPLDPDVLKSDWFKNNTDRVRSTYLGLHAEKKWTVGNYPITVKRTFDDKFEAIAFFVRQKVGELAEIA